MIIEILDKLMQLFYNLFQKWPAFSGGWLEAIQVIHFFVSLITAFPALHVTCDNFDFVLLKTFRILMQ